MQINELMKKIANGDQEAFEVLYRMTRHKVKSVAMNILKFSDIAEDAVQETYIKVLKNCGKFRPDYDDERWIIVIAENTAKTMYKNLKRDIAFRKMYSNEHKSFTIDERVDESAKIMELLNDEEKIVVKMKIAGYSQKEIEKHLKCNRNRINYLMRTAKSKLENYIKKL